MNECATPATNLKATNAQERKSCWKSQMLWKKLLVFFNTHLCIKSSIITSNLTCACYALLCCRNHWQLHACGGTLVDSRLQREKTVFQSTYKADNAFSIFKCLLVAEKCPFLHSTIMMSKERAKKQFCEVHKHRFWKCSKQSNKKNLKNHWIELLDDYPSVVPCNKESMEWMQSMKPKEQGLLPLKIAK